VLEKGPAEIGAHERGLAARFARAIAVSPRVRIAACPSEGIEEESSSSGNGTPVRSDIGLVSFTVEGYQPAEVATVLDETFGIAVRAGPPLRALRPPSTRPVSGRNGPGQRGTVHHAEEIDEAASAVLEIAKG
jgi:selenocysteine lyase/cysteine desulfurase